MTVVLAHQTLSQLGEKLAGALQNTNLIALRVGQDDAMWAAKRLSEYDPNRMKLVPGTMPGMQGVFMRMSKVGRRPHIRLVGEAEQRAEVARFLTHLHPGEALVRVGDDTNYIRTLGVPHPRAGSQLIAALKNEYARRLLTPKGELPQLQTPASAQMDRTRSPQSDSLHRRVSRVVPLNEDPLDDNI